MSVCMLIRSSGTVATGSDVSAGAASWNDVNATGIGSDQPVGTTNTVTISGIDTPITARLTWVNTGDAVQMAWVKNGVVQSYGNSPRDVSVILNDTLAVYIKLSSGLAKFDLSGSGTATIVNHTDGDAAMDTFAYSIERIAL